MWGGGAECAHSVAWRLPLILAARTRPRQSRSGAPPPNSPVCDLPSRGSITAYQGTCRSITCLPVERPTAAVAMPVVTRSLTCTMTWYTKQSCFFAVDMIVLFTRERPGVLLGSQRDRGFSGTRSGSMHGSLLVIQRVMYAYSFRDEIDHMGREWGGGFDWGETSFCMVTVPA